MTRAREQQICCEDTPYYHCISRVVRKAFLCGYDRTSQQNYEHRRQWVIDRLAVLSEVFCIDICAYAIMSNHYHLVLYINKEQVDGLTDVEVVERWRKIYNGPDVIQRFIDGEKLSSELLTLVKETIDKWRNRLEDISWFMRCLNEHIARKANFEDNCKGRFWEGRFKSQALLDQQALLTCMTYVELNPIRAKIAETPEGSEFTSIKQRVEESSQKQQGKSAQETKRIALKAFVDKTKPVNHCIPYSYQEYLALVDWSGRIIKAHKRGAIHEDLPPILLRLNIDPEYWIKIMSPKGCHHFSHALGCKSILMSYAKKLHINWIKGIGLCSKLFPT